VSRIPQNPTAPDSVVLPIDEIMPEIVAAFQNHAHVLVKASPGSGKTTRIPVALEKSMNGSIYILQPRRIAARLAAERVAHELGSVLGEKVGYHFRFEKKRSAETRILFFTEGLFLRELQANPDLKGVACVLLDEFHERHLSTDLAFGALLDLQRTARPDLKLGILSATLDSDGVSEFLENQSLKKEKPKAIYQNLEKFPLTIEYQELLNESRLSRKVSRAIGNLRRAGATLPGTECLVFLPGMREIRDTERELVQDFSDEFEIVCLHSELTKDEQEKALLPRKKMKVILATNIAESSVTFPRVRAVIDSGLVRQKVYRSGSGLERLITTKISQASAIQRAGRAARTGPGSVIRLYSEKEFLEMRKIETPEVLRTDPVEFLFEVYRLRKNPDQFPFLSPPTAQSIRLARDLFTTLGVIRDEGLTRLGERIRELPLSPRLALLFILSDVYGLRSVLLPLIVKLQEGESLPLDAENAYGISDFERPTTKRSYDQLSRTPSYSGAFHAESSSTGTGATEKTVPFTAAMLLLKVFPERFSRLSGGKCFFSTGRVFDLEAKVKEELQGITSGRKKDIFSLVLDAEEKDGSHELKVFTKLDLDREEVEAFFMEQIEWTKNARFCRETKRILLSEEQKFLDLVMERWEKPVTSLEVAEVLQSESLRREIESFYFREGTELLKEACALEEKLKLHQRHAPELRDVSATYLRERLIQWLMENFEELRRAGDEDILATLRTFYPSDSVIGKLEEDFPAFIALPRRKRVGVTYESGKNPWMESRLQDFLGLKQGPTLLKGKLPITLHLNAPNGRAVQVTEDLARFWQVHYPTIRKELLRRYPRHPWPEDPMTIVAD
jgi:ATP-dependent helicase HrpB